MARDEEIKKIQNQISAGMQTNATNLQNYLGTWDNYREIWEINKDHFIRRYQKLKPHVSAFDADIARFVVYTVLFLGQCDNLYKCLIAT